MAKAKVSYSCSHCQYISIKWLGCCPECSEWDTFTQQVTHNNPLRTASESRSSIAAGATLTTMQQLPAITYKSADRMLSGIAEWDRVLGNGIMPGSLLVLTGDPGIGKSTLLLQVCNHLAKNYRVFYFSTEESLHQVKQRAERLACVSDQLWFSDNADFAALLNTTEQEKPDVMVIDSIQNCYVSGSTSLPGSVGQLREATFALMRLAKEQGITVIITSHITKEGTMAGPKTLEHMVDGVFYLQGEERWQTRVLRAVKNRFGTIHELGFFEMEEHGLSEVPDINKHVLSDLSHAPGSVLVSVMEGSRLLLLELQALTIESKLSMPQRVVSGVDSKQVVLIAAILQKYLQIRLNTQDIFFKVSGGLTVKNSATDLGIALALLSSYFQQPLAERTLALGEISLTGQIKPINHINQLIHETEKFGISNLIVAASQRIEGKGNTLNRVSNVYELVRLFPEKES